MVFYGNTMTLKSCGELVVFSGVGGPGEEIDLWPLTWCSAIRDCSCPLFCRARYTFSEVRRLTSLPHCFIPFQHCIYSSTGSLENFPWLQVLVLKFCFATGGKVHGHTIWMFLACFKNLWSSESVVELSMMEITVNIVN